MSRAQKDEQIDLLVAHCGAEPSANLNQMFYRLLHAGVQVVTTFDNSALDIA